MGLIERIEKHLSLIPDDLMAEPNGLVGMLKEAKEQLEDLNSPVIESEWQELIRINAELIKALDRAGFLLNNIKEEFNNSDIDTGSEDFEKIAEEYRR